MPKLKPGGINNPGHLKGLSFFLNFYLLLSLCVCAMRVNKGMPRLSVKVRGQLCEASHLYLGSRSQVQVVSLGEQAPLPPVQGALSRGHTAV